MWTSELCVQKEGRWKKQYKNKITMTIISLEATMSHIVTFKGLTMP